MKYTPEILANAVKSSLCYMDVLRELGINGRGSIHAHIKRQISRYNIDTSHFLGNAVTIGKPSNKRKKPCEALVFSTGDYRESASVLRRCLQEVGVCYKCSICGMGPEWQGRMLVLQVDHIDGNWRNNSKENLRFLCPNCHTQTDTYGSGGRSVRSTS